MEQDTFSQASMYNILRKDVEQNLKQVVTSIYAFAEHAQNTLVFTAFLLLCTAVCAHSAFLSRKTPAAKETETY